MVFCSKLLKNFHTIRDKYSSFFGFLKFLCVYFKKKEAHEVL